MLDTSLIDSKLKTAIAITFNIEETDITCDYLESIVELDLVDRNIECIKGIELCKNLRYLNISRNRIKEASILSNLNKLSTLIINNNKLEDVSFISSLKFLVYAELKNNNIKALPDLSNCRILREFNVSNNRIDDIASFIDISNREMKLIAKNQLIKLKPEIIKQNLSYLFINPILIDNNISRILDNVQINGICEFLEVDKVPYMCNSISKIEIKNIHSDCDIKCDFLYELNSTKEIVYSGTIIKQLIYKNSFRNTSCEANILYGNIDVDLTNNYDKENLFKCKTILLIQSDGTKFQAPISNLGSYEFQNLTKGSYTVLFPYFYGYTYTTQSLYIINLLGDECVELSPSISISQ